MNARRASPADESFAALLAAAQTGAPWACRAIWDDHASAVAGFLRARGSREPDDLTSEVFLAVFDRLPTFVGGAAELRSFIFSIAYRRLVDELRSRARRGEIEEWTPERDPRTAASAEDDALARLGEERARRLLDGLASDQRDVLSLRILADLTIEQIAVVLGKSPGAVKALQRRGLETLRRRLAKDRTLLDAADDSDE